MQHKRLIVIDISNFIFRAFFAIRPLHAPDGTPVNAVQGVLSMLMKLFSVYKPTHVFIARDSKEKSFRHEMYNEYKAHRDAPPEELIPQFALIEKLIQHLRVPELIFPGYEADDIIGSAAVQWKDEFDEVYLATGDKDLMQFVDEKVKMLDTMKEKLFGPPEVFEKMGVHPNQIVDYLSLVGDSSDNIPGMKGVGAKGAAKLLAEYGTLEKCIENKTDFKNKRVVNAFENHVDDALLSKKLVQIVTDLDLKKSSDDLKFHFYPHPEVITFLKDLGMNRMVEKLGDLAFNESQLEEGEEAPQGQDPAANCDIQLINDDSFDEFYGELSAQKTIAYFSYYDLDNAMTAKLEAISVSYNEGMARVLPLQLEENNLSADNRKKLLEFIWGNSELCSYTVNAKFDMKYAVSNDLSYNCAYEDMGLGHYVFESGSKHDIASMSLNVLAEVLPQIPKGQNINSLEGSGTSNYLGLRSHAIFKLKDVVKKSLEENDLEKVYRDMELPLSRVLGMMELHGVGLNCDYLKSLEEKFTDQLMEITCQIDEASGGENVNLNSPKQVGALLFEKLDLPIIKKTKTGASTDVEVLTKLDQMGLSPIPGLIMKFRELDKLVSTYVSALPKLINPNTKKIHTHFNQTVAATGRLSSDRPNLQNIPIRTENGRLIRKAFVPSPGNLLVSADYSQVELRLLAHFSEDPIMVAAFLNDEDIHAQTAAEVFEVELSSVTREQRSSAKGINFGLMYGQSSFGLAGSLGISRRDAKDYITNYFLKFSRVKSYLDELKEIASEKGYSETMFGRKRFLPDINSSNRTIKSMAERLAINSPIQGTAADIIKVAMIGIDKTLSEKNMKSKMILQVHDELIFEVEESELDLMQAIIKDGMENAVKLRVPLRVDMGIGVNWYDLK